MPTTSRCAWIPFWTISCDAGGTSLEKTRFVELCRPGTMTSSLHWLFTLALQDFVDERVASSSAFKKSMSTNLTFLFRLLPQYSAPFYSPRYMAHMVNDVSMPATLGYLMGLMYNPNNISPEAGPLTHIIEYDVGQQLCNMVGFNAQLGAVPLLEGPTAWGHITCGGSIANMESMW
jgi:hypothetical protein